MTDSPNSSTEEDRQYHSYTTDRIPWYVRAMWIVFWIGLIWYVVNFVIPLLKEYF